MNEWWLLAVLVVLLVLAIGTVLYPWRKSRAAILLLTPVLVILPGVAYLQWGALPEWTSYLRASEKQQHIQAMLKTMDNPARLITKMKITLKKYPNSARGWYLLGRLYVSQGQWQQADAAYARAHQLEPENVKITVNYVQNLWQLNQQQFDETSRHLLKDVLHKNPQQADALAMLAMDAWRTGLYQQAIDYWERLLKLALPQSEEANAIRKAIAKAREKMHQTGK